MSPADVADEVAWFIHTHPWLRRPRCWRRGHFGTWSPLGGFYCGRCGKPGKFP